MRIAAGEEEETLTENGKGKAAVSLGKRGGKTQTEALSAKRRADVARAAARKRWKAP